MDNPARNMLPSNISRSLDDLTASIKNLRLWDSLNQISAELKKYDQDFKRISQLEKEVEALSKEELYDRYEEKIEQSRYLGNHGWVVSGTCTPFELNGWIDQIEEVGEETISEHFEDYINNIISTISKIYVDLPEKLYLNGSVRCFNNSEYTSCAMLLLGIIDKKIKEITPASINKYSKMFSDTGFEEIKNSVFKKTVKEPATKVIYIVEFIPSLIEFLNRVFVDGDQYDLDKGIEPRYLNRNWLIHGRMTRDVKRFECLQLFNALDTLDKVVEELNHEQIKI